MYENVCNMISVELVNQVSSKGFSDYKVSLKTGQFISYEIQRGKKFGLPLIFSLEFGLVQDAKGYQPIF